MACELYSCLLPQCEALRICRSGFPIATLPRAFRIQQFLCENLYSVVVAFDRSCTRGSASSVEDQSDKDRHRKHNNDAAELLCLSRVVLR